MKDEKSSRVVDLEVIIPCAMCDPRGERADAVVLLSNDIDVLKEPSNPDSESYIIQCFTPVCYPCLVANQELSSSHVPVIHLTTQHPDTTEADMSGITRIMDLTVNCVKSGTIDSAVRALHQSLGLSPELSSGIVHAIDSALDCGMEARDISSISMDNITTVMHRTLEFVHDGTPIEGIKLIHNKLGLSLKLSKVIVDVIRSAQSPVWRSE